MRRSIAAMTFFTSCVGRRLGLRREVFRDVELADIVAERCGREIHAALPASFLLGRAVQGVAVESEVLLVERRRQVRPRSRRATADQQLVLAERRSAASATISSLRR